MYFCIDVLDRKQNKYTVFLEQNFNFLEILIFYLEKLTFWRVCQNITFAIKTICFHQTPENIQWLQESTALDLTLNKWILSSAVLDNKTRVS